MTVNDSKVFSMEYKVYLLLESFRRKLFSKFIGLYPVSYNII